MASIQNHLSFFFFLVVLFLSPQIQARQNKLFSFFTHFKTTHNLNDHQLLQSQATTPAQEPAPAPELGSTIPSGPAPEPEFLVETGNGYGLYGIDSTQYSPNKETPKTITDFENELLNEDFNDNKSYKKGYPQTNFHNNNEVYTKSYGDNSYDNNYERKGEGMSDTRLMENGKYYYNVNSENESYGNNNGYESGKRSTENEGYSNNNGYESGKRSTENEGYNYEKNQYQNEFETMEEYEKQQEAQGYTYTP